MTGTPSTVVSSGSANSSSIITGNPERWYADLTTTAEDLIAQNWKVEG